MYAPLNDSEKVLSTRLSLHNDHHIVDSTISISDTRKDNDVLSYKHHLVSTDDSQILDSVVLNDEAMFCNISSGIVDNSYSTTKVDGKVYFPQHDFYNNDGAIIDSSAVHFFQNLKEYFIFHQTLYWEILNQEITIFFHVLLK